MTARESDADKPQPISEQEKELATTAISEFERGNWTGCLQPLAKLETLRPNDVKVLHNRAVAELYRSELRRVASFGNDLRLIAQQARIRLDSVEGLEEVDHCTLYYNQAVLLYHSRQYWAALKILNKLLSFLEPMEEGLARQVCILLIELHLLTNQPDKALGLIDYVESQMLACSATLKVSLGQDKDTILKGESLKQSSPPHQPPQPEAKPDAFRLKLQQQRVVAYLANNSLRSCKRELKGLMSATVAPTICSIYLKAHLEYRKGNPKKAMKVLNSAPNAAASSEFHSTGQCIATMYYNNTGCIHYAMGKPNLACFYLQKALKLNEELVKSQRGQDCPLYTLGANRHYELIYNLGITLLLIGRPVQAFECLLEALQVYHTNPRIWTRLAECCVKAHKEGNASDFKMQDRKKELVQGVVGTGSSRKILFVPHLSNQDKYNPDGQSHAIPVVTLEFAALCLKNALFLLNPDPATTTPAPAPSHSYTTLPDTSNMSSSHPPHPPPPPPNPPMPPHTSTPASPMPPQEIHSLRCSALCTSAYVSLCLGNYLLALRSAESLLAQPTISGMHRLLGHLYAAEALLLLDKVSDAMDHLKPEEVADIFVPMAGIPGEKEKESGLEPERWVDARMKDYTPCSTAQGRATMQYNLCVAYVLRGEADKAGELLRQLWVQKSPQTEIPVHVVMLALYIQLQLGHTDITKQIIKRHHPQYR